MAAWSGIRKKLEDDYLCPSLRGHIRYYAVSYSKSDDHEGRAAILLDGVEVLRSSYYAYAKEYRTRYQEMEESAPEENPPRDLFRLSHRDALNAGCFDNWMLYEAFSIFDNQSIGESLVSENPLVRVLALLDRRLGKRRLLALKGSMERELDWVRAFYVIRMEAEGLMEAEDEKKPRGKNLGNDDREQGEIEVKISADAADGVGSKRDDPQ